MEIMLAILATAVFTLLYLWVWFISKIYNVLFEQVDDVDEIVQGYADVVEEAMIGYDAIYNRVEKIRGYHKCPSIQKGGIEWNSIITPEKN